MSINLLESHDSLYFLISDRMTESITCSICLSTLNNPVLTRCGHSFCENCIYELKVATISHTYKCPVCRTPNRKTTPNYALRSLITYLKNTPTMSNVFRKNPFEGEGKGGFTQGRGGRWADHKKGEDIFEGADVGGKENWDVGHIGNKREIDIDTKWLGNSHDLLPSSNSHSHSNCNNMRIGFTMGKKSPYPVRTPSRITTTTIHNSSSLTPALPLPTSPNIYTQPPLSITINTFHSPFSIGTSKKKRKNDKYIDNGLFPGIHLIQ